MTTKKITRTFELTIEQNQRLIVRRQRTFFNWCPVCRDHENFASPEVIAQRFDINQDEIFRLLENGKLGIRELAEGSLIVCLGCVNGGSFYSAKNSSG